MRDRRAEERDQTREHGVKRQCSTRSSDTHERTSAACSEVSDKYNNYHTYVDM